MSPRDNVMNSNFDAPACGDGARVALVNHRQRRLPLGLAVGCITGLGLYSASVIAY
jgi:hypothetical protein